METIAESEVVKSAKMNQSTWGAEDSFLLYFYFFFYFSYFSFLRRLTLA